MTSGIETGGIKDNQTYQKRERVMKRPIISVGVLIALFAFASVSLAGDFDWMKDFNVKAEADSSGFKARLSTRFKIGNMEINAVLRKVDKSADAYMILRLGEMSGNPIDTVITKYKSGKGKGWGSLAKSLGIKPGSAEFHALKRGDDLYNTKSIAQNKGKYNNNVIERNYLEIILTASN